MNTKPVFSTLGRQIRKWAVVATLAVLPFVFASNQAIGGPGIQENAVNNNRASCVLPPFLNVAVTERPNVMILYDNATSMSLQAYSKEYSPTVHYYGLFNADTCYSSSSATFTKDPIFPEEVIGTPAKNNPALKVNPSDADTDPDIKLQHESYRHYCTKASHPYSGNFMNWAAMRRIDLLRRAFTFGDGDGGAGQRNSNNIQGEFSFAPCYNKSYTVPLAHIAGSPTGKALVVDETYGRFVYAKVVDGQIIFGRTCPAGTAVTSGLIPLKGMPPKTSDFAYLKQQSEGWGRSLSDSHVNPFVDELTWVTATLPAVEEAPEEISEFDNSNGIQVASLMNVMNDVGVGLLAAPPAPDLSLTSWTISDASSGLALTNAYPGQVLRVVVDLQNISTNRDFTGTAASIIKLTLAPDTGVNASSPEIPASAACVLGTIVKGGTKTVTCDFTVPLGFDSATYPAGAYIGVFVNPSNAPNESSQTNNSAKVPFYIVESLPDLVPVNVVASIDAATSTFNVTFDVTNAGVATGNFTISSYIRNPSLGLTSSTFTGACSTPRSIPQGGVISYSCSADMTVICGGGPCLPGTYRYAIVVDESSTTVPAESDTSNNALWWQPVYIGPVIGSELEAIEESAGASYGPGDVFTASYRIRNNGQTDSSAAPTMYLRIFLNSPSTEITPVWPGVPCPEPAIVPGLSVTAVRTCSFTLPSGAPVGAYTYYLRLEPNGADADWSNHTFNDNFNVAIPANPCTSDTACDHDVKVNFFGRNRTGLLWEFNKKELGTVAPANIGVGKFSDWTSTGLDSGAGAAFFGVEGNQGNNNNHVAHLEKALPTADGSLSLSLLNMLRYYANKKNYEGKGEDPLYYDPIDAPREHKCRKNYILYITDGISFGDNSPLLPDAPNTAAIAESDLKDYYKDLSDPTDPFSVDMIDSTTYSTSYVPSASTKLPILGVNGTFRADNVALYGNMVDQRKDLDGKQTVQTIVVHTFADSGTDTTNFLRAQNLMKRVAVNGSFVERDATIGPSAQKEWDQDLNGVPDGYFPAGEGSDLGEVILRALSSILLKTASGTSVSVIASTSRGEGAVYQSYFRPVTAEAGLEINWLGFMQALWVDKNNKLREDTVQDGALVLTEDRIIDYVFNSSSKETFAVLSYTDENGNYLSSPAPSGEISLSLIKPIFESGRILHDTVASGRTIFTWPHWATDVVPAGAPVAFTDTAIDDCTNGGSGDCLKKHLWPSGSAYYDDVSVSTRLMRWVRGDDDSDPTFRKRTISVDGTLGVWKLGDIIYSTPTVIGTPEERYDLLYGGRQEGYSAWYAENSSRRRVVAVGANDGMMHAFNGGVFRGGDKAGTAKKEVAYYDKQGKELGEELWAYIPGSLLPNLRMLADVAYDVSCHVYFVDLKPKVTDVQIFYDSSGVPIDDTFHKNGWGTILIGGMRLGCGDSAYASYFILDVSNPDAPFVLAEFGENSKVSSGSIQPAGFTDLSGLDFSFFYPNVLRINDPSVIAKNDDGTDNDKAGRWFMVVGSGPNSLDHTSDRVAGQSAMYIFDLTELGVRNGTTPAPRKLEDFAYAINKFADTTVLPANMVISNGLTADLDANFSVDSAYFVMQVDSGLTPVRWTSSLLKLLTLEDPDPTKWKIARLFNTATGGNYGDSLTRYQSMTAAPSITRDESGNIWIYFGTGRFIHRAREGMSDRVDDVSYGTSNNMFQQSLYGVIDPCGSDITCVPPTLTRNNLLNVSGYDVTLAGPARTETLTCSGSCLTSFSPASACTFGTNCKTSDLGKYISEQKDGWYHNMSEYGATWEMSYNKPAVAGGLVLFTTYGPATDPASCTLGGGSYLYILDFMTGTASKDDPFEEFVSTATGAQTTRFKKTIDSSPPSPPAIFGKQIFVQGSNANVTGIKTNANFKLPPYIRGWNEQ